MKRKITVFAIIILIILILIVGVLLLKKENKLNNINGAINELYEYGEYIESLDILPNTIVAKINGEEILFHEVECYRNSINYSIENGTKEIVNNAIFIFL